MIADMLTLKFDHQLQELLPRRYRSHVDIHYPLDRRASIKDIVESLHIPHTEIGSIEREGEELSFTYIPEAGEVFELHSLPVGTDVTRQTFLRPQPLSAPVFMVDINVGKLASLLRMVGIDTWYYPELAEAELARQAAAHDRILLSRNRDLLRRKIITWGHLVRAEQPEDQLVEIIILYGLQGVLNPFSRCLECNTLLRPVDKSAILHQLEPLTIKYYHQFKRCPDCGRIYWRGSHHRHMQELMTRIQAFHGG
jgi:uncharacterized protein with PIN domain